eukprot:RCo049063
MSCSCPEHLEHSGPAAEEKDSSDDEGGAPAAPAEPEDEDKVLEVIQADSESVNLCFLRVARMQTFQLHRLTRCTSLSLHRNLLHSACSGLRSSPPRCTASPTWTSATTRSSAYPRPCWPPWWR